MAEDHPSTASAGENASSEQAHVDAAPAKSAEHSTAKAGAKKKGKKTPISVRLKSFFAEISAQTGEIFRGLRSPDHPTRKMSLFFFLSLAGVVFVGVGTVQHFARARNEAKERTLAQHSSSEAHESENEG